MAYQDYKQPKEGLAPFCVRLFCGTKGKVYTHSMISQNEYIKSKRKHLPIHPSKKVESQYTLNTLSIQF